MKIATDIKSTAQRVLDAYHLDHQKYGVPTSLANVCRVLASTLVPHEDIDLLPSKQLLCLAWELEHVDVADEMVYAEQVVTGEPNE